MKILHRYTGKPIYKNDNAVNFRDLVELAVKEGVSLKYADFTNADFTNADFTNADFTGANFRNAYFACADFTGANFEGVDLTGADFRWANLTETTLTGVNLTGAYLKGANLTDANLTDANLTDANLTGEDLEDVYLRDACLKNADFTGTDFTGADLTRAYFTGADINGAKFDFKIPKIANIHQKIYEAASGENALNMRAWHTCATTHCIAGWTVFLAGKEGDELEKKVGTETAATLIYLASDNIRRVPGFYNTNEEALTELKELAESE